MSRAKRVLKYLFLVIVIFASFSVFLFGLRFFSGYTLIVAEGTSMEPTIHNGDLLVTKEAGNKSSIQPQEIIVFHEPYYNKDVIIAHRIVERIISNGTVQFETRGDNNPAPDPWAVPETDIIGVVVYIIPVFGSVILFIQSPITEMFTVILLIFLIVANILYEESTPQPKKKKKD